MVRSTSEHRSAVWWIPRAVEAARAFSGFRCSARMRSRSLSMAARSIAESLIRIGLLSDPEEQVQELVGEGGIAAERAGVHPAERGEDQARRVELEHHGEAVDARHL